MKELTRAEEIERSIYKKYQKTIWNKFIKGIKEYRMIEEGDKIAVCISGGKDSMLMAKCMQRLQKYSDVPFDILFLVMDPGYSEVNRQRIMENAATLELPLEIFDARFYNYVVGVENNPCYLCARMRRGHLYNRAKELGCNKIALGHHYDDVIETILMGMLYGSQVQTMMPKLYSKNFEGMELIRPLYLVREEEIISWAKHNDLHFLQCACRFTERNAHQDGTGESKRLEIKHLIRELKKTNPAVESNIFRSVENVNLDTIISYHKGDDYHHFLDEYHEEHGTTRKGTPEDKKRNI